MNYKVKIMNVAKPKSFQEIVLRLQNYWSDNLAILSPTIWRSVPGRSIPLLR